MLPNVPWWVKSPQVENLVCVIPELKLLTTFMMFISGIILSGFWLEYSTT